MKKVFLLFLLLTIQFALCNAQNWLWAKGEINISSGCDPWAITADNTGNVFETGTYYGGSNIFGADTITSLDPNAGDVFLVKYSSSGNAIWARTSRSGNVGGHVSNIGNSVAADRSGNTFITGTFIDSIHFGGFTLSNGGYYGNAFIVKYDPNGNVLWAKSFNTSSQFSSATGMSVATDTSGNVFITGYYADTISIGPNILYGGLNAFIAKYDLNGNVLWATNANLGAIGSGAEANSVATDNVGNAYITGNYQDSAAFGPFHLMFSKNINVFVVKYSPSGNPLWASNATPSVTGGIAYYFGGTYLTCDSGGNVYAEGIYHDTVGFGSYQLRKIGSEGIFLVKYNSVGNVMWAKTNSYSHTLFPYSISVNKSGTGLYFCGDFTDTMVFGNVRLISDTSTASSFILKFDSSGNALCGSSVNNNNDDYNSVAVDPLNDDAYFGGDVGFENSCKFGNYTIKGTSEYGFISKWKCNVCGSPPVINTRQSICVGQSVTLYATGGTNYLWNTGSTKDSIVVSPAITTTYKVLAITDSCYGNKSATIIVNPLPLVTYCCDSSILMGQSVQLISSGGGTYTWSPSNALSCANCPDPVAAPDHTTTYTLTVTTDSGCTNSETVTIDVTCGSVFIPSAFSPNNDGQNDILYVRGPCIKEIDLTIFDRWGNKVFESENINNGWDGTYKGQPMNTGTYVYYLKAMMQDGSSLSNHGNITLVR